MHDLPVSPQVHIGVVRLNIPLRPLKPAVRPALWRFRIGKPGALTGSGSRRSHGNLGGQLELVEIAWNGLMDDGIMLSVGVFQPVS
jgi:hypothetical protein